MCSDRFTKVASVGRLNLTVASVGLFGLSGTISGEEGVGTLAPSGRDSSSVWVQSSTSQEVGPSLGSSDRAGEGLKVSL